MDAEALTDATAKNNATPAVDKAELVKILDGFTHALEGLRQQPSKRDTVSPLEGSAVNVQIADKPYNYEVEAYKANSAGKDAMIRLEFSPSINLPEFAPEREKEDALRNIQMLAASVKDVLECLSQSPDCEKPITFAQKILGKNRRHASSVSPVAAQVLPVSEELVLAKNSSFEQREWEIRTTSTVEIPAMRMDDTIKRLEAKKAELLAPAKLLRFDVPEPGQRIAVARSNTEPAL